MANQPVTKIYDIKTLGYSEVIRQLTDVEAKFKSITELKKQLNQQKFATNDADELIKIKNALEEAKAKTIELRLEKQRLTNEALADKNIKAAETAAIRANTEALGVEAGSYTDTLNRAKQLYALLKNANPTSGKLLSFEGNLQTFDQLSTKYKQLIGDEKAFRRQFQEDAILIGEYTTGIVNAFKQMGIGDLVGAQASKATAKLRELDTEFERLKTELASVRESGGNFDKLEGQLVRNRKEAFQLTEQIAQLRTNMQGMGTLGQQVTASLAQGFQSMKGQLSSLLLTYIGLFAAFQQVVKFIKENAELSDAFSDLQIRIHGTKQEVDNLVESLRKIDTRTSLKGLVDIANVVAKKGIPKEEIAGLTKELDRLFVVLGKEAGDPAEATSSIIKLITIFNDDKHVTADRVNEIGTALFKLTTTGVATGAFLINFAERVGAVRGITGLTLPTILGMGAALEQLGQRVELSSTAMVQLSTKIFSNVPKFAEAAKKSVEEFRALLTKNPFEALVAVAEGLKDIPEDLIKNKFEDIVQAFGEVGVTGVRIKTVLADIATNAGFVRQRMKDAGVTLGDYGNIAAGADLKQRNFGATLDKIKKQFELLGTNQSFQNLLIFLSSAILGLITNLQIAIPAFLLLNVLLGTTWGNTIALTSALILENLALGIEVAQLITHNIVRGITNTILAIYTSLISRSAFATGAAAVATRLLAASITFLISPIGIAIGLIATFVTLFGIFSSKAQETTRSLSALGKEQKFLNEIREEANKTLAETISKENILLKIIGDRTLADKTREAALRDLKTIMGQYGEALTLETILTDKGTAAILAYNTALLKSAEIKAAENIAKREEDKLTKLIQLQKDVATAMEKKTSIKLGDENAPDIIEEAITKTAKMVGFRNGADIEFGGPTKLDQAELKKVAEIIKKKIDEQLGNAAAAEAAKIKTQEPPAALIGKDGNPIKVVPFEIDIPKLQQELDNLNKIIKEYKGSKAQLEQYIKERDAKQAELDAALEKKTKGKKFTGSKIPGQEKDDLAEIDAQTKLELAAEEERYAKLQVININGLKSIHIPYYQEELDFINKISAINRAGLEDKIRLLEQKEKLNAREKELLATFHEELAKLELKRLKDVQALDEKQFKEQSDSLKANLDKMIAQLQEAQERLELDPNVNDTDKAVAKKKMDDEILRLTEAYYTTITEIAKKYAVKFKDIEDLKQKEVAKLIKKGLADDKDIVEAGLSDIDKTYAKKLTDIRARFAALQLEVLNSNKSKPAKKKALAELDKEEEEAVANINVAAAAARLRKIKKDYEEGKKTLEDLQKAEDEYVAAVRKDKEILESSTDSLSKIREGIKGFGEGLAEAIGLTGDAAELFAETFALAEQALNSYFDLEQQRIQHSTEIKQRALDIELQQRKDRAQSTAEEHSLDKEFAQKKDKLAKEAFEKEKKLKLQQAKINFAIQLSNIAVAASANPLNPFTFGAAGIAQYILQAAIATAAYVINTNSIRASQFKYGGNPDTSTTRGGRVGGRSHEDGGNPFLFKGRVFEDEVGELNIIRTKNVKENLVHTITGTHTEIASKLNVLGGGVEFKPGAKLHKKFETGGVLGSQYKAPEHIISASVNDTEAKAAVKRMMEAMLVLADEQSKRIDRIEVWNHPGKAKTAQTKFAQQEEIGTL